MRSSTRSRLSAAGMLAVILYLLALIATFPLGWYRVGVVMTLAAGVIIALLVLGMVGWVVCALVRQLWTGEGDL